MSHIFISYNHDDKIYLEKVLAWLSENKLTENDYWFDQHISGGDTWRDEIIGKLDGAYVVLVVMTNNLVESLFCTFEWAYAMGQGIPILPLLFEDVSTTKYPAPLAGRQYFNCKENIPDSLKESLRSVKSVSPQVYALHEMIYDTIFDTHRRFFILRWVGKGLQSLDYETRTQTLSYFLREAYKAQQKLEQIMVEKAFAMNGKQHRLCWKLVDYLKQISKVRVDMDEYMPERISADFDIEWMPAFDYFDTEKGWWHKGIERYFNSDLDDGYNKNEVLVEIARVFPMFNAGDADIFILNKTIDMKRAANRD